MRLQRDPLALGAWKQIAQTRHGRIPSIGADQNACGNTFIDDINLPIVSVHLFDRADNGGVANFGAELTRALQKQVVEETPFDCDLRMFAARKFKMHSRAVDGDELDRVELAVGQRAGVFGDLEALQDRPARRIQRIAANFLARKFLTL